jgi:nickel superoxide dismutase
MKRALFILFSLLHSTLSAHCQMPCGVYHDNMVYDMIDQYVETMYKGMSVLKDSKFHGTHDWNEFIRWVILKEKESDETAKLIMTYFLQQKIKPGEADNAKKLESAHKLLFLLVGIKQNTDVKFVKEFLDEWEDFKEMFHVEGYQCQVELLKQRKKETDAKKSAAEEAKSKKDASTEAKSAAEEAKSKKAESKENAKK